MPPVISKELNEAMVFCEQFPWYQTRTSPCEINCPAGNAIQRAISLIQDDHFEEALADIRATNPFPGVTGRVCFYPCETACNRGQYDRRVPFRSLERAISDHAIRDKVKKPLKLSNSGKKIAVIGSGPAGMTCAYYSMLLGHDVTIFEGSSELGGVLRVIPQNRLPRDVVDREIGDIVALGLDVKTGVRVGQEIKLQDIIRQYDACLIATGAWKSMSLDIPGSDLAVLGLPFLHRVSKGETPDIGENVVVVGSGGSAFDCATTALRLGAGKVHLAALEGRDEMLATPDEVERGLDEGIILHNAKTFTKILSEKGKVTGIECLDIRSFMFNEDGNLQVDAILGTEQTLAADTVIFAVGQTPDPEVADGVKGLGVTGRQTLETLTENVFVAGDVSTGSRSIVEAIGDGRRVAVSIHDYLTNRSSKERIGAISIKEDGRISIDKVRYTSENAVPQRVVDFKHLVNVEYFKKMPSLEPKCLPAKESLKSFEEISMGYTKEEAIQEADRCFHCGHCFKCSTCVEACPEDVYEMTDDGLRVRYPDECFICGVCVMDCPCSAITMRIPAPMRLAAVRVR